MYNFWKIQRPPNSIKTCTCHVFSYIKILQTPCVTFHKLNVRDHNLMMKFKEVLNKFFLNVYPKLTIIVTTSRIFFWHALPCLCPYLNMSRFLLFKVRLKSQLNQNCKWMKYNKILSTYTNFLPYEHCESFKPNDH
jgi:hypothetical protein